VPKFLSYKPPSRKVDTAGAAIHAARERQVSRWRIALESLRLSQGPSGLSAEEYFLDGAWRPGLTWTQRKEFVGIYVNQALNLSLNPPKDSGQVDFVVDKLASAARFAAAGLPQPQVLAVAAEVHPGPDYRWLDGPEATLAFLTAPGNLPCFGKPVHGSTSTGAASLVETDQTHGVLLGSGQWAPAKDLVNEIWDEHSRGFVFQELVKPHPDLAMLIGPVIGTLRVVTLDDGNGPQPLYAAVKVPAAGAMVDGTAGPVGCSAAIDLATGTVLRVQDRRQMGGTRLDHFPVTGTAVEGAVLPDFHKAVELAVRAHRAVGDYGILGADILLSDRGPIVNEVNANPFHTLYQSAFSRGILNPDFLPKLRAVRARFRHVTPRPKLGPLA
jgi:hypothetical protein